MSGIKDALLGDELYDPLCVHSFTTGITGSTVPAFQHHSTPSREAAHSIAPRITDLQRRVLDYLKEHPEGATDNALGLALDLKGSTLRPRRIELVDLGLVVDSGRYARDGGSKRRSTVWIIKSQSSQVAWTTLMPPV